MRGGKDTYRFHEVAIKYGNLLPFQLNAPRPPYDIIIQYSLLNMTPRPKHPPYAAASSTPELQDQQIDLEHLCPLVRKNSGAGCGKTNNEPGE